MFDQFRQRSLEPERLDTGDYTPQEYAKWQREMGMIHRVLGEKRALRGSLLKELDANGSGRVSILEVGAGSGELLRDLKKWVAGKDTFLVGSELSAKGAASINGSPRSAEILGVQCDALNLPFADGSFDYIFSSLFLHHLTDEQSVALLNEMSRVARKKFFVIDLRRHVIAYYFYRLFSPLVLQRFTQEDGALSILKSFRPDELRLLASGAGVVDVNVRRSAAYRMVLSGRGRS